MGTQAPEAPAGPGSPGAKRYRRGTHRVAEPRATLERVRPLMAEMGITRVANVTGLDRIGIPVVMVCRPNSRSLAVHQGKGLDLDAAKASGLMEAAESFHAETITLPLRFASYDELAPSHPVIDVERLPRSLEGRYDQRLPLPWIEGRDLVSGEALWLPFELVSLNYTVPPFPGSGCFPATSNGLASGNHLLEAISHGVFEIIERDALTLWRLRGRQARLESAVDPASVGDPLTRELLDPFERAEVEVRLWDATSDIGIACFVCLIMSRKDESADPEFGAGCHPMREVALIRALTEAAQARLTYISGARDDFASPLYGEATRQARLHEARGWLAEPITGRRFDAVPTFESDDIQADIDHALERLARIGAGRIVAVDLTKPELGIPVVRIVVPGLEGAHQGIHSDYVPGARARAVLEGCG